MGKINSSEPIAMYM